MKIEVLKEHKSISSGLSAEIPSFCVMTGVNGSGKTHLFEALADPKKGKITHNNKQLAQVTYLPFNALNPTVNETCDANAVHSEVQAIWNEVKNGQQRARRNKAALAQLAAPDKDPTLQSVNAARRLAVLRICDRANLMPHELEEDTIAENLVISDIGENSLFSSRFATIFKAYHVKQIDNMLNKVYIENGIEDGSQHLNSDEFRSKHGPPPWEFVDSILDRLHLPYQVSSPAGSRRDTTFEFKLLHKDVGFSIGTNALSTGEKSLMCLALAIYNTVSGAGRTDMLIIDEPDAPLHPSMSHLMLRILHEDIVEAHGIPVLISSHSPTTIACAPAWSLHSIHKATKQIERCEFADVTAILSHGVPNLNVSIESRRQVFVEHRYDVLYYERLFSIASRVKSYTTVPQFLPPHDRNGANCKDVMAITRSLRDMGNTTVYGVVDWDTTNDPEPQLIVLGHRKRYAIENYIFEPHILGLYLVYRGFCSPADVGLPGCQSYYELGNVLQGDAASLQAIADAIEARLGMTKATDADAFCSKLLSGAQVTVHRDICVTQGHDLEERCKESWPPLKGVRSGNLGDSALKLDIISTVINDHPGLMSMDFHDLFVEIK